MSDTSRGVMLYDFVAEEEDELMANEGDVIDLIQDNGDGWSTATLRGKTGLVPTAYYELLSPDGSNNDGVVVVVEEEEEEEEEQQKALHHKSSSGRLTRDDSDSGAAADRGNKFLFGLKSFKKKKSSSESSSNKRSSLTNKPSIPGPRVSAKVSAPRPSSQGSANGGGSESNTASDAEDGTYSDTETLESTNNAEASPLAMPPQIPAKKMPREPRPPPKCSEKDAIKSIRSQLKVYLVRKRFTHFLKGSQFRPCRTRNELIRETLSTERTYVNLLSAFVEVFCEPLKNNSKYQKILDQKQQKLIFSNAEQILKINQMLLSDLEKGIVNWPRIQIGSIFKNIAPFLKAYTTYINNYDNAFENYEKFEKKNSKFKEFLSECYANARTEKHKFDSFLILPIQRIPRYKMLLQDILKNTSETHVEHNDLKIALDEISNIASFVNEKKREKEQSQVLLDLSKLLKDRYSTLVQPNRQFVREGKLKIRSQSNSKGLNDEFNVYFFSDVIIAMDTNEKKKITKRTVHFIFLAVTVLLEKGKDSSCDFVMETLLYGNKETLVMTAENPDERALWEADVESNLEITGRHLKNKGFSQSLTQIGQERLDFNSSTEQCLLEHGRLEKEYQVAEKKLQKIEHDLSASERQLEALIEKIQKQRMDKKDTEMQLDEVQSVTLTVRRNLGHFFQEVRTRDQTVVSALEEEDAFKQIFGEPPATEREHNAAMPLLERPQRQHYVASNEVSNTLAVGSMVIHLGKNSKSTSKLLPQSADKRKMLPVAPAAGAPGSPGTPRFGAANIQSPPKTPAPAPKPLNDDNVTKKPSSNANVPKRTPPPPVAKRGFPKTPPKTPVRPERPERPTPPPKPPTKPNSNPSLPPRVASLRNVKTPSSGKPTLPPKVPPGGPAAQASPRQTTPVKQDQTGDAVVHETIKERMARLQGSMGANPMFRQ